jgi:PPM family protein phosphatase
MRFLPDNAQNIGDRSEQQDSFGFSDPGDPAFVAHAGVAAVVADGMGGLANGGAASCAAVQAFLNAYAEKGPDEPVPDALLRSIRAANQAVMALWRKAGAQASLGSTLAAVALHDEWLYWVSAGDSRVYLVRGGQIVQLTTDHVYAADLEAQVIQGSITREQATVHPEREALTSYLGLETPPFIDRSVRAFPVQAGDWVLICSDGLCRALSDQEIAAALQGRARKRCEALVQRALAKRVAGQDNITAIALRCRPDPPFFFRMPKSVPVVAAAALAIAGIWFWRNSAPHIGMFAVDRPQIYSGQTALLRWSVDRGSVTITPDIGRMSLNAGTRSVSPSGNMRYTLVARNLFGSDRRSVEVDVLPPHPPAPATRTAAAAPVQARQPSIVSFSATPSRVIAGKPVLLKWSVRNAYSVHLDPPGFTSAKAQDSRTVTPAATTTYTLTAATRSASATAKLLVTVAEGPGGKVSKDVSVPQPGPGGR